MLYVIGRFLYRMLFKIVFRYRIEGRENVPSEGGVLLVANHASLFDPPLVGSAMTLRFTLWPRGICLKSRFWV